MSYYPTILSRFRNRPLTCLGDAAEIRDGGRSQFAATMPTELASRKILRKWWEWDYLAECAELTGILSPRSSGIGLGVGSEPLIFYYSNLCAKIVATDLYSGDTAWGEARFDSATRVYSTSPIPFQRDRLEIRNADMRSLGVADQSMDFAWSCSSIEHVPTLKGVLDVFDELARVLRVGGYAFLTTEFCVTEPPYLLPGVNAWDASLLNAFIEGLGAFEFVGATDLSYNFAHPANAPKPRRYGPPGLTTLPTIPLLPDFRGGQMANPVGLSVIVPIALVLRRRRGKDCSWEDLKISPEMRTYTQCVERVRSRNVKEVVGILRPLVKSGPGAIPLQFYHHICHCYFQAMAIDPTYSHKEIVPEIFDFMHCLPPGSVQDADCLDLIGYLLGEAGEYAHAANVLSMGMLSPSTTQEHVLRLAFAYLQQMYRAGKLAEGVERVVPVLVDLAVSAISYDELKTPFSQAIRESRLGNETLKQLRNALESCLAKVEQDCRVTLRGYADLVM